MVPGTIYQYKFTMRIKVFKIWEFLRGGFGSKLDAVCGLLFIKCSLLHTWTNYFVRKFFDLQKSIYLCSPKM